jgi:phosphomannomutase
MQKDKQIKFGTDGWRGIISDDFTFHNVRQVAQAIADYYNLLAKKQKNKAITIAVGYDTRFLSGSYAQIVANVLSGNGIEVLLSDKAIPTPTLSFTVKNKKLTAGIMITASHNPCEYNGIKIKTSQGGAAGTQVTKEVEKLLTGRSLKLDSQPSGKVKKLDFLKDYVNFLRSYIDLDRLKNVKFNVLVDAMYGSGNSLIQEVLFDSEVKLEFTRNYVNPSFGGIRPEPVLENLISTQETVKKRGFDLCLVLDGDADRIACFGQSGEFISPQKILGLLILHLSRDKKIAGGVVKTIVGTTLIDKITRALKVKLYETPVGFKYISALMEKEDILIGGEEAGGIGFKGYIPERDGTLAGLLLLEMMAYRKKTILEILREMEREFGRYYYARESFHIHGLNLKNQDAKKIKRILGEKVVEIKDYDGVKLICRDESWLMFRGSGTEPIMRIYAESASPKKTERLLQFGREKLGK